jgi:hypothetical protein
MHLIVADDELYKRVPGSGTLTLLTIPAGVTVMAPRPCFTKARKESMIETIINGKYNPGRIWFEAAGDDFLLGITAPAAAPTIATQGTGLTGTINGYITFVHKISGADAHESNLSPQTTDLVLANQGVRWTLPTTHTNDRVTHVRIYRTPTVGGLPRKVADVTLGTATYDEAVTDAVLQEQDTPPVRFDAGGSTILDPDARGVPPYCLFATRGNGRVWYAGDPDFPARVWHTRIGEGESVNLEEGYDDMADGDAVTGLAFLGNEVIAFTHKGMYAAEGFDEDDIRWRRVMPSFGCIAHHGIKVDHNVLIYPSAQGIVLYDGGVPRNIMSQSIRDTWIADYKANAAKFQNGIAGVDEEYGFYVFLPEPRDTAPKTIGYLGDLKAMFEDGQAEPRWALYKQNRGIFALGELYGDGEMGSLLHYGDQAGVVRRHDATDGDDDGDTFLKRLRAVYKHFFYGDQGGHDSQGRKMTDLDLFMKHENNDVLVNVYGGDEEASTATRPSWYQTVRATLARVAGRLKTPKTSHHFTPGVNGKGHTVEIIVSSPVGVELRGLNISTTEGEQTRLLKE